jgi:nucleoside-diphosphate-sugar epimerase
VWEEGPSGERQSPTSGITLFTGTGDAERDLLSVLDTVELHHGIAAKQPAVNTIRVLGVEPTDAIREALRSLRFGDITTISDGFIARWSWSA